MAGPKTVDLLALAAQACGADCAGLWVRVGGCERLLAHVGLAGAALEAAERDPLLSSTGRATFDAAALEPLPADALIDGGRWVALAGPRALTGETPRALQVAARLVADELARARAEAELSARAQLDAYDRFRSVFEGISDAVFLKDTAGRYMAINAAGARQLGRSVEEVLGRTDSELFDHPSSERIRSADAAVLGGSSSVTYETDSTTAGGVRRHWLSTKAAFRGTDGAVAGLVGISRDVSAVRRTEQEKARLLRTIEGERARLEAVLHHIPSGVVILEAGTGRILLLNQQAADLFSVGIDEYAFLQDIAVEGYGPGGRRYRKRDWPQARSLIAGEVVVDEEVEVVSKRGARQVLRISSAPLRGASGAIEAAVTVFNDITERRRAEVSIRDSEERLRLAVEAAELGVWDCDLASGRVTWNDRQAAIFGVAPGIPGTLESCLARVHPDDRPALLRQLAGGQGEGADVDVEFRVPQGEGGEPRCLACRGRVFRDASGKPARMIGVVRDVTAARRTEQEAQRLAAFREQLLGIVGHDLRNPLTAILAAAELQTRLPPTDARNAFATQRIQSSGLRMQRLIADLLDLTRARLGGGLPLARRRCDLSEVLRQVVDELQISHPARAIHVHLEGNAEGEFDPERMAQVLSNLVGNALQHSADGSEVSVRLSSSESSVDILVHSLGDPIPSELLPMVFESFRSGRKSAGAGMGLGLFIVRLIVRAHGGTVEVNSHPVDGTSFTVRLPRSQTPVSVDGSGSGR